MPTKRTTIAMLVGCNLLLLVLLLAQVASLPGAYGQVGGRTGDFISVTAKAAGQSYDVLYLLDVPARRLHAFYPDSPQARRLMQVPYRDLSADFGRE